MLAFGLMAPLTTKEAEDYDGRIERAFRRACAVDGLSLKEAAFYMLLDESQLVKQLHGREPFQFRRTVRLGLHRPQWFGWFWRFVGEELELQQEMAVHGMAGVAEALFASGRARMARASLRDPRSEEDSECGKPSLRGSA
jgi:hypothetical protein